MGHRRPAECLSRSLRDIRAGERPFGGVAVGFSGDFRHAPTVVRHGSRSQVVDSSLKRSPTWRPMRNRVLTRNLRLLDGEE